MNNNNHVWNQVKLGDMWINVDLTYASDTLRAGNRTGDLFMSDMAFYGDRKSYITPYLTSTLIESSRHYDENYKRDGKSLDYKGVIPYVGSSVEKMRSSAKNIETSEHLEY